MFPVLHWIANLAVFKLLVVSQHAAEELIAYCQIDSSKNTTVSRKSAAYTKILKPTDLALWHPGIRATAMRWIYFSIELRCTNRFSSRFKLNDELIMRLPIAYRQWLATSDPDRPPIGSRSFGAGLLTNHIAEFDSQVLEGEHLKLIPQPILIFISQARKSNSVVPDKVSTIKARPLPSPCKAETNSRRLAAG